MTLPAAEHAEHAEPGMAAIRVRLFAGLREQAGWGDQPWPLDSAATPTAQQIWEQLGLPGTLGSGVRIAINQQFAAADTTLQAGDELAFLPPISGG